MILTEKPTINNVTTLSVLRNNKKNFYSNLDTKVVTDNRAFGKLPNYFCLKT